MMIPSRLATAGAPLTAISLVARVAGADHPGALRSAEMSPLVLALVSGGLALAAGLLVVVIVMLLTRKPSDSERTGQRAHE